MFTGDSLKSRLTGDGGKIADEGTSCRNYTSDANPAASKIAADGAIGLLLQGRSGGDTNDLSTTFGEPADNDK